MVVVVHRLAELRVLHEGVVLRCRDPDRLFDLLNDLELRSQHCDPLDDIVHSFLTLVDRSNKFPIKVHKMPVHQYQVVEAVLDRFFFVKVEEGNADWVLDASARDL